MQKMFAAVQRLTLVEDGQVLSGQATAGEPQWSSASVFLGWPVTQLMDGVVLVLRSSER